MKTAFLIAAFAALAGLWAFERISAAQLAAQIGLAREQRRELADLQQERERLRRRLPTEDDLEQLRRAVAARTGLAAESATRETAAAPPLPLGDWLAAADWRNCGNANPRAAIETTLWAAAGGDAASLKRIFTLPNETRRKVEALLAGLTPDARSRYPTAEDLIAEFTIKNIPVGEVQLVWLNHPGADDATACVFLQNPRDGAGSVDFKSVSAEPPDSPARASEPPRAADNGKSSATYLSLHREPDGWRLVVPPGAVDKLAQDLQGPPRS